MTPPDPAPDLAFDNVYVSYFNSSSELWICLNDTPYRGAEDFGDEVVIDNLGDADAEPYHVTIGLQANVTGDEWMCLTDLDSNGVDAGEPDRWDGPLCCELGDVPAGDYVIQVRADAYDDVAESDESNNVWESAEIDLL